MAKPPLPSAEQRHHELTLVRRSARSKRAKELRDQLAEKERFDEQTLPSEIACPHCHSGEMHPREHKLLIRALKVRDEGVWWSHCLVCAGHYNADLEDTPETYDPAKGWFST